MGKRIEHELKFEPVSLGEFNGYITDDPLDKFAKTFRAKANMLGLWPCLGAWSSSKLLGAIAWTIGARQPKVANLQLLHVFASNRLSGVGRNLCNQFIVRVIKEEAEYFRVSSEPTAVEFYRKLGITFLGKQKSGCLLSIAKLGATYKTCKYDPEDPVIAKALCKKGKGGCIEFFNQ